MVTFYGSFNVYTFLTHPVLCDTFQGNPLCLKDVEDIDQLPTKENAIPATYPLHRQISHVIPNVFLRILPSKSNMFLIWTCLLSFASCLINQK